MCIRDRGTLRRRRQRRWSRKQSRGRGGDNEDHDRQDHEGMMDNSPACDLPSDVEEDGADIPADE
eukprot:5463021-Pyramimonas_sp.AAC.1